MRFFKLRYWFLYPFRTRLRCPYCHSVGTYKPFPALVVNRTRRVPRRFLCKNCGKYENEYGRHEDCQADRSRKCWTLPEDFKDPRPTPQEMHKEERIDPWAG